MEQKQYQKHKLWDATDVPFLSFSAALRKRRDTCGELYYTFKPVDAKSIFPVFTYSCDLATDDKLKENKRLSMSYELEVKHIPLFVDSENLESKSGGFLPTHATFESYETLMQAQKVKLSLSINENSFLTIGLASKVDSLHRKTNPILEQMPLLTDKSWLASASRRGYGRLLRGWQNNYDANTLDWNIVSPAGQVYDLRKPIQAIAGMSEMFDSIEKRL